MSKNAATIAEAISLLSDVLVHDTAWEAETERVGSSDFDDLKEQAIEFGNLMSDDLSTITDDLDRVLDLDDEINGEADEIDIADWPAPDYSISSIRDCHDDADDEDEADEPGNGEVDSSDTDPVLGPDDDDDDEAEPTDDEKVQLSPDAKVILEEKNAELEKNNEELSDRIEDLIDTVRDVATNIKRLNASAESFIDKDETI